MNGQLATLKVLTIAALSYFSFNVSHADEHQTKYEAQKPKSADLAQTNRSQLETSKKLAAENRALKISLLKMRQQSDFQQKMVDAILEDNRQKSLKMEEPETALSKPLLMVNNKTISVHEFHDRLNLQHGSHMLALMTKYYLLTQAAEKAGVSPTKSEIEAELNQRMESNPNLKGKFKFQPWTKLDLMRDIEMAMCAANLCTKGIVVTDDEITDYFNGKSADYNSPKKYLTKVLLAHDMETAKYVHKELQKSTLPIGQHFAFTNFDSIVRDYSPNVALLFHEGDGTWIIKGHPTEPSKDPILSRVERMKSGEVIHMKLPDQESKFLIIALEGIEPSKKATLSDVAVKRRVVRDIKITRARPTTEVLKELFDAATIEISPPQTKEYIETLLFPERFGLKVEK